MYRRAPSNRLALPSRTVLGAVLTALVATPALAAPGVISGKVVTEGKPEKAVVVFIEKVSGAKPATSKRASMEQAGTQFRPSSIVVVQGQTVDFPNNDKFFHNVFSVTPGNEFDLGMYRGGASKSVALEEPGEIEVYCNIHPNMTARILVLQNDHHTQAKADGTFTLKGVPPGSYTLVAWSAEHEPQKVPVLVTSNKGPPPVQFSLKKRKEAEHLNKYGEQYGRYK